MRVEEVEIREWGPEALGLLDALAAERWVDLDRLRSASGAPRREVWVAWHAGRPVGLVVLDSNEIGVEITIAVPPERRRAGLGSELLGFARSRAADARQRPFAVVALANDAALAFFEHHGLIRQETDLEGHVRYVG